MTTTLSSADRHLAARIEAAEAENLASLARVAQDAGVQGATHEPFAGGAAVYAGVGSPMTHAMGLGFSGHVSDRELERLEAFFRDRGSPCLIDLSPLAAPSVVAFVQNRPYRTIEFNNVLARRIDPAETFAPTTGLRQIAEPEYPRWAEIIMRGFSESMPIQEDQIGLMCAICKGSLCWLAEEDAPVGGAAMGTHKDVALF